MNHKLNIYQKTRLRLTLLYFIIIGFIVAVFSFIVIVNQYQQLEAFARLRNDVLINNYFNNPVLDYLYQERNQLRKNVDEIRQNIITNILIIDAIILFISSFMSYYLSGETLKPIMESLEKQKRFVSDASHELKTPLTAMKTEAEVLLRSKKVIEEDYKAFIRSSIEEVDKLNNLATNLLYIAKSDNNSHNTNIIKFELIGFIDHVVKRFTFLAKDKKVSINFDNRSIEVFLFTDKDKLEQLLGIIIENAIKYNKENGLIDITIDIKEDNLELSIKDTGIGISKHELTKIFDRFYRVSTDRNTKGFGLGLSIAKEICDLLSIDIKITSLINQGTLVKLRFTK